MGNGYSIPGLASAFNTSTGWMRQQIKMRESQTRPVSRDGANLVAAHHYGFAALGVAINVADMALPAALGVLAEAVVFFLPLDLVPRPLGYFTRALFAFISVFALTNSLRMASITAADQTSARADR